MQAVDCRQWPADSRVYLGRVARVGVDVGPPHLFRRGPRTDDEEEEDHEGSPPTVTHAQAEDKAVAQQHIRRGRAGGMAGRRAV